MNCGWEMTCTFNAGPSFAGSRVDVELRLVSPGCVVLSRGLVVEGRSSVPADHHWGHR
jgi:hypothetical protein